MAVYKAPRTVQFVDELPKSGTGKILWRELQAAESASKPVQYLNIKLEQSAP